MGAALKRMAAGLLVDTDVLVDFLRAAPPAVNWLDGLTDRAFISAITVGELYAGVREGLERETLEAFIRTFEVLPIDETVARRGGLIRRDYGPSHGVGLADALLAATALVHELRFVTLNRKHFPMLENVVMPYQKA
jgi:predicted nucleic acid-binding protein